MMTSNAGSSSISAALEQRYAVLGEVGRGTFGRVYKARQISTGQDIALKILASSAGDLDGERHRQRFRCEMPLATSRGAGAWASRSSESLASLLRARGSQAEAEEVITRATSEFPDADATCSRVETDA